MKKGLFLVIIVSLLTSFSFSQKGFISGTVTDAVTGEAVVFAKVIATKGEFKRGADTGFDGAFKFPLDAGTYKIEIRDPEHNEKSQTVIIVAGEEKVVDFKLAPIKVEGEVEIVGKAIVKVSRGAKQDEREKQDGAVDNIGEEAIAATGARNASQIIKALPGVSVVGGKDVYVRGLGDRYTKTNLNSMDIPGLDPDKNSVQMDIFPSTVVSGITVYKTFTPNLPGDFTGGLVNIETRTEQTKKTLNIRGGLGYNHGTTFNNDFILYRGSKLDALAFGAGDRANPLPLTANFADPTQGEQSLSTFTNKFSKTMGTSYHRTFLNQNYSAVYGNAKDSLFGTGIKYGFNAVVNYRNKFNFYEDVKFNTFVKENDPSQTKLFKDRTSTGNMGQHEVLWSALFGQSFRFNNKNKATLTLFHTQNALEQAVQLTETNFNSNDATLAKEALQYTQRSVSNMNIAFDHKLKNNWNLNWKLAPTYSKIDDPDVRSTVLEIEENEVTRELSYHLNPAVGSEIRRSFRDLTEVNLSGRFDFVKTYKRNHPDSLESEIKFGGMNNFKRRNFNVYDYTFELEGNVNYSAGDPNWYFQRDNIWTPESKQGLFVKSGGKTPSNSYLATSNVASVYGMHKLPITKKLQAVYGVRLENTTMNFNGQNSTGNQVYSSSISTVSTIDGVTYNPSQVLNKLNVLPSLNLKYKLKNIARTEETKKEKMNLRLGLSQTVARPSFKEKSQVQIYDPLQGRRFNGNINLKQTNIINGDLRWEWFFGNTEVLSASTFYKRFNNPIEIATFAKAPSDLQPINAGVANVYGLELELRKQIAFLKDADTNQRGLFLGVNGTYVNSQIDMSKVKVDDKSEWEIRKENAREGETVSQYRNMAGQSPYIINAYLNFVNGKKGWNANLSYNVQGKRLSIVGVGNIPDVYEKPFNSLNLKVSKAFGKNQQWKAGINVRNLLNAKRQRVYESYGATPQIYDYFYQGVNGSATITYKFFQGKK